MVWLTLDRSRPLVDQVYEEIRNQILSGGLGAGHKLPSTRELAQEVQVSRNVIIEAYEQLLAEGYIEARQGSGTFVASGALLERIYELPNLPESLTRPPLRDSGLIDFRPANPALDSFPRRLWSKLAQNVCLDASPDCFGYDRPEGRPELREAVAEYLRAARGVKCHPAQIIVTNGASQAFTLIARVLLSANDQIIVEDPLTKGIQDILQSTGARVQPVPVDANGLITELIHRTDNMKLFFVTPSHQSPLGGTMPVQRRIQLIELAQAGNSYIVEDDYDSEFRYSGQPISSLQGLAPDRVIYVGTFSKVLSPALRVGYLILPPGLIEQFRIAKWSCDRHVPVLNQLTLARLIADGHLRKHVVKMKKLYRQRRTTLIQALNHCFGQNAKISGDSTGLNLIADIANCHFDEKTLTCALAFGIHIYCVEDHAIVKGFHCSKLILGYGNLAPIQLIMGVRRLKEFIESLETTL